MEMEVRMLSQIKKKYFFVAAVGAALAAIISFGNDFIDLYKKIQKPEPILIQFALSESSFGYEDSIDSRFAIADVMLRTFGQTYPLHSPPRLVLSFTIQNPSDSELLITSLTFNVTETGQVMSLTPRPLAPNKLYKHKLDWKVGKQNKVLVPVYSIPSKTTGSFEVEILADRSTPLGAGLITTALITTNMGILETEKVQIYLPVSKTQNGAQATEGATERTTGENFQRIRVFNMVDHRVVNMILESSKLKTISEIEGFDALEKDLMFHRTASYKFEEYINSHSFDDGKTYGELFPEENLLYFWNSAREYIENQGG